MHFCIPSFAVFDRGHPWDPVKRFELSGFLARTMDLRPAEELTNDTAGLDQTKTCLAEWPRGALTTDELARALTGKAASASLKLWDAYPVKYPVDGMDTNGLRGDLRQVFAQFEAFLADGSNKNPDNPKQPSILPVSSKVYNDGSNHRK